MMFAAVCINSVLVTLCVTLSVNYQIKLVYIVFIYIIVNLNIIGETMDFGFVIL